MGEGLGEKGPSEMGGWVLTWPVCGLGPASVRERKKVRSKAQMCPTGVKAEATLRSRLWADVFMIPPRSHCQYHHDLSNPCHFGSTPMHGHCPHPCGQRLSVHLFESHGPSCDSQRSLQQRRPGPSVSLPQAYDKPICHPGGVRTLGCTRMPGESPWGSAPDSHVLAGH